MESEIFFAVLSFNVMGFNYELLPFCSLKAVCVLHLALLHEIALKECHVARALAKV
jgi:hypothetical protein